MTHADAASRAGEAFVLPRTLAPHRVPELDAVYLPDLLSPSEAAECFAELRARTGWAAEHIKLFGREVSVPRLVAWAGDPGVAYRYSGIDHRCTGWPAALARLAARVAACVGWPFNFALLNLYRTGRDHMGWHADAEKELGAAPVIASVSLGAPRPFAMRAGDRRRSLHLANGSLLLMFGQSQTAWRHALPRAARVRGERINVTFRRVIGRER